MSITGLVALWTSFLSGILLSAFFRIRPLMWLCLYPVDVNTSKKEQLVNIFVSITVVSSSISTFIAGSFHVWKFVAINLEESLFELILLVLVFDMLYTFLILFRAERETKAIFEHLVDIYIASISSDSPFICYY